METLIDNYERIQSTNQDILFQHDYSHANDQSEDEKIENAKELTSQNLTQIDQSQKDVKKQTYEILLQQKQQERVTQYLEEIKVLERSLWNLQNNQIYSQKNAVSANVFDKIMTMKIGVTSQTCSVCFQGFEKNEIIKKLPCKHIFHMSCIKPWLKKQKTCPNCRDDIPASLQMKEQKKQQKRSSQNCCQNDSVHKHLKKEIDEQSVLQTYETPTNNKSGQINSIPKHIEQKNFN